MVAIPLRAYPSVPAGPLAGKTVIDADNYYPQRDGQIAELDSGAAIELGRGTEDEVVARTELFARTLSQVTGRYHQPIEYADLRHQGGYALRLRGVGTTPAAAKNN